MGDSRGDGKQRAKGVEEEEREELQGGGNGKEN